MSIYSTKGKWRYRTVVTLSNGKKLRISGMPSINTKTAAEERQREHIAQLEQTGEARIGRPPIGAAVRDSHINILMPSEEVEALRYIAERSGLSVSELGYRIITAAMANAYAATLRKQRRSK